MAAKHPRQAIRGAVVAQLIGPAPTYRTDAFDRVYPTRLVPWRKKELPAIGVYTLEESIDPASKDTTPRELTRVLLLVVQAVVAVTADVDDVLDTLALQIEKAMHLDEWFGGTAGGSVLTSTDIDVFDEGDEPMGVVKLVYEVTYFTVIPEEETLDDLKTVDGRYTLANLQEAGNQANDRLEDLDA